MTRIHLGSTAPTRAAAGLAFLLAAGCSSDATPGPDAPATLSPDAPVTPGPDAPATPGPDAPLTPSPDARVDTLDAPPPVDAGPDAPPVSLHVEKSGAGSIESTPAGISCGPECASADATFPAGTQVTLQITPAAGSYFAGWNGACAGIVRSCELTLVGAATTHVRFETIAANLVFVTADTFDGDLGGLDGADAKCQAAATDVGLSGHYVALLSSDTVDARSRLVVPGTQTPARGFVRLDGLPIADTVDDLFTKYVVLYPVLYDQDGSPLASSDVIRDEDAYVWTGSFENGTARPGLTCDGYTTSDAAKQSVAGQPNGGPGAWLRGIGGACSPLGVFQRNPRLYCFGVDSTTPLSFGKSPEGKLIYMTISELPMTGREGADALCDAEKPVGAGAVKALLTTTDAAAAAVLDPDTTYLRVDGTVVGTGADLVAVSKGVGRLQTGLWQRGDGTYVPVDSSSGYRWLGVPGLGAGLDQLGTPGSTCNDWTVTDGSQTGSFGEAQFINMDALSGRPNYDCHADYLPIFCVEE